MKKYLLTILPILAIVLSSCDNNDEESTEKFNTVGLTNKITIQNIQDIQGLSSSVSEIAFVARVSLPATVQAKNDNLDSRYMLRIPFNKESMTIELPENPPQSLLRDIEDDIPAGFEISNRKAKTISFVDIGCCSENSDKISGRLIYRKTKDIDKEHHATYELHFIYCDSSVKITGSGYDWWGYAAAYNLQLEKGWNMVIEKREYYLSMFELFTVSNWMPNEMQWHYDLISDKE